ncbi:MAG: hypothetical protein J7M26_00675, partial [Armatimonadetes bacterium]|nr:hypothetical protein [Armatimonadota bacterium]
VMEIPQQDEMRTFLKLRYDWDKPCSIEGDARRSFRWLNIWAKELPTQILWTGTDGKTQSRSLTDQQPGQPLLLGEPLAAEVPFVASHGEKHAISCLVLVRSLRARLGGHELSHAAVSAEFSARNGSFWLTVPWERLALQPGDFLEAEVMLMPHGEPSPPGFKPERERRRYGLRPPRVSQCRVGKKLADFPARVRARQGVAAFTLEGGHGTLPVIVEGFRGWKAPLLWQDRVWQDPQAHGGDGWQVEGDGQGGYRFVLLCPHREDQKHDLMVTRAICTTGISRLFDRNGYVVLQAPTEGEFRLKAPVFFAPGVNRLSPAEGVVSFVGHGREVQEVPLEVSQAQGPVQVDVEKYSPQAVKLTVSGGPLTLRVGGMEAGETYRVQQGEKTEKVALTGPSLVVKLTQQQAKLNITLVSRSSQQ